MKGEAGNEVVLPILLVEDEVNVLQDIKMIIEGEFPRSAVITATNVQAAVSTIRERAAVGERFRLGLLDCKLPASQGMQDEVDTSVCTELRKLDVPIIHFSAWPDDNIIQKHMEDVHPDDTLVGARVVLVHKTVGSDWIKELIKLIKPLYTCVVSERVARQLKALFGEQASQTQQYPRGKFEVASSGTYAHITLRKDILDFWDFLSHSVKARIRAEFDSVELDGPQKRLALFKPGDSR